MEDPHQVLVGYMRHQNTVKPAGGLGCIWNPNWGQQFGHRSIGEGFGEPQKVQLMLREGMLQAALEGELYAVLRGGGWRRSLLKHRVLVG